MQGKRLREFLSFIFVSGLQLVANYGTYLIILPIAGLWPAFLSALAVGLTVQTILQITRTFREKITLNLSARYVGYQLCYTAVFAGLLKLTVDFGIPAEVAPIAVMMIATPINYVLSRWVIKKREVA